MTKQITICGKRIQIGDYLKVRYTTGKKMRGATIQGIVTELWEDSLLQARLSCGWCFHDCDEILEYEPCKVKEQP